MDKKGKMILYHYTNLLETRKFDEFDILGFLIFIRDYVSSSDYPYIRDFAHLVAHRRRNIGRAMRCITVAIENEYLLVSGTNKVDGYHGVQYSDWEHEWVQLANKFQFNIDNETILEITLCVFSLAQFTEYDDDKGHKGFIDLMQGLDGSLALYTHEGTPQSLYVCFALAKGFNFITEMPAGHILSPVYTIRENGILRLKSELEYLI